MSGSGQLDLLVAASTTPPTWPTCSAGGNTLLLDEPNNDTDVDTRAPSRRLCPASPTGTGFLACALLDKKKTLGYPRCERLGTRSYPLDNSCYRFVVKRRDDLVDRDALPDTLAVAGEAPQRAETGRVEVRASRDPFRYYRRLRRLLAFVIENIHRSISAEEAASVVGLERQYFSTWFHRTVGVSWSYWLAEQRVAEAERLFHINNHTVVEAALASGFGSVDSFCRACKRHRGMTPRELRALSRR
jgi:AraC-like DNA-binding protein